MRAMGRTTDQQKRLGETTRWIKIARVVGLLHRRGMVRSGFKLQGTQSPWRRARRTAAARSAGFTLVEIMVVVMIISMLVALLVPTVAKVKRRSQTSALANDLRVFASAFEAYAQEAGNWAAEVDVGVFPTEMQSRLNETSWQRVTPIGGHYNWDNNQMHRGTRYRAVIAINSTSSAPLVQDVDLWEAVDRLIDDGNLTTGNFQLGADDEPIFIVAR